MCMPDQRKWQMKLHYQTGGLHASGDSPDFSSGCQAMNQLSWAYTRASAIFFDSDSK